MSGHHNHHKPKTTILEDVHEFASNVWAAGFGLLVLHSILKQYKVSIFNSYVLGLFMVAFPLVHLCIYHRVLKKSYHEEHHTDPKGNFSPDFFDHMFGTNLDHRIEDTTHMVPVFAVVGLAVILVQRHHIMDKLLKGNLFTV